MKSDQINGMHYDYNIEHCFGLVNKGKYKSES